MELLGAWTSKDSEEVLCLDTSPNGATLAAGTEVGVDIWDVKSGSSTAQLKAPPDEPAVNSVCFSPKDSHYLWTGSSNIISLFDLRNPSQSVDSLQVNSEEVNQIAINENNTYLAAGDDNGEIRIIDLTQRKLCKTLRKQHQNICSCVAFSRKKATELFSGSLDCSLVRWNFLTAKSIQRVDTKAQAASPGFNPPMVHSISISTDGIVAAGLGDCTILIATEQPNGRLAMQRIEEAHSYSISQVMFPVFDLSSTLVSGGNDRKICTFRRTDSEFILTCTVNHKEKINWLSSFRENTIAVADCSPNISLYRFI